MSKKKSFKFSILIIIFCVIFCFGNFAYNKIFSKEKEEKFKTIEIENFDVNYSEICYKDYYVLKVGESFKPSLTFYPSNLSEYDKTVFWTTNNSNIVSIDYFGTITALKKGVATVTITSSKDKSIAKTIKIKVVDKENNLSFPNSYYDTSKVYSVGQISQIEYVINGQISLEDVLWESSDTNIITVENGYLKACGIGTAKITMTSVYDDAYKASYTAIVRGKYTTDLPKKITFGKDFIIDNYKYSEEEFETVNKYVDNVIEISANTDQEKLSEVIFTVTGGNYEILELTNNKIIFTPKDLGTYTLSIQSSINDGLVKNISFEVKQKRINGELNFVSLDNDKIEEISGIKTYKMEYGGYLPIILESKDIRYSYFDFIIESSNTDCIIVENGYLRAIGVGVSNIEIVHCINKNVKYSIKIDVRTGSVNKYSELQLIQTLNKNILDYDINTVICNSKLELEFVCYPLYATNAKIIEALITNNLVCNVNTQMQNGNIKVILEFLKPGFSSLIIECIENPNLSLQYDFEVVNNDEVKYTINPSKLLERGQTGNCNVVLGNGLKGVEVTYTSSDPSIVSVGHAGELVGLGYGTATISIHATDGVTSFDESFEVECVKEHSLYDALNTFKTIVKMNDEEINLNEKLMYIGDSFTIDVSFTPSNHPFGKYHEVKIEKPEILSVDKNNNKYTLKCLKSGTTKVTVYPYANPDFSVEYTVVIANIMPKFMFVSVPDKVMYVEDRYQFGYLIDWRATYSNVDIIIGDDSMVSVEDDYLVIKKAGKTYVSFIIDDNDDNTVSYVQTFNIEAFDHSTGVRLERYGYGNFIVRIISQVICALIIGILAFVIANKKPLKLTSVLNYVVVICGILVLLILCNVLRMSIKPLGYEKYDMITNIISYVAGLFIGFVIYLLRSRKEKGKNA